MWGLPQRQGSIHQSTFDVSHQLIEREEACLVHRLPRPRRGGSQDEVKLSYQQQYCTPYARSLAHARGGSQDEEKILLLPPFTPRPYYLGQRDYHIVWNIYVLQYSLHLLIQGHYKKYILHLYKATNSNRDKSYYSLLSSLWLNFKISPTKVDGEWSN